MISDGHLQGCRQVKKCAVDTHGEREVRAYNGGLGKAPLKLKTF